MTIIVDTACETEDIYYKCTYLFNQNILQMFILKIHIYLACITMKT